MSATMPGARAMNRTRAGLGAAHLAFPGLGGRLLLGGPFGDSARTVVRVLGARQIAQTAASWVRPTPAVLRLGAEVDALHCASMLVLAILSRRWRRPALASAAIAGMLARAGLAAAHDAAGFGGT